MITVRPPGDRHIGQFALFLAAQSPHESRIRNLPSSRDIRMSLKALHMVGVPLKEMENEVIVQSRRPYLIIQEPRDVIHLSDSFPTATLMLGFLAGYPSTVMLSASGGLQERDFQDLVRALRLMGAMILGRDRYRRFPMAVQGGGLQGMVYEQLSPNAYTKGAMILAAFRAIGESRITERIKSWDHMERLLLRSGVSLEMRGSELTVFPETLPGIDVDLPGDFSLSVPFLTAALMTEQPIRVEGIHLNLTRTGFLRVIRRMGAQVRVELDPTEGPEAVGNLEVRPASLTGVTIREREALLMEEELPFLILLATRARGMTVIEGLSNMNFPMLIRVMRTAQALEAMGVSISQSAYRLVVQGPTPLRDAPVKTHGDGILGMLASVIALLNQKDPEKVSGRRQILNIYPDFFNVLRQFQQGGKG